MKDLSISSTHFHNLKNSSKKWIIISFSLIFSQIILLFFIHYKQKTRLKQLSDEISTLEAFIETQQPILDAKQKLKKELELLLNKKANLIGNTKLPKLLLKKIIKSIPADCCLSTLSFKNNIISIKGSSKTWAALNSFFDALSKIDTLGTIRIKNSTKESQYLNFEIEFSKNKK